MRPNVDFETILEVLNRHDVAFIVIGGVAAVLQGAPMATFDLDIVHRRDPQNLKRLLAALRELDARYRTRPQLEPLPSHLESAGHQLLATSAGPLDVLGEVGSGRSYETLLSRSRETRVGDARILVLDLQALIELKEESGRSKDRAVLELLRETLSERDSR